MPFVLFTLVLSFSLHAARAGAAPFADPAFSRVWERTDAPVLSGLVRRSWYWGPEPGRVLNEPFAEGANGVRQVQYFDKARMEINDPRADRSSEWFVTTGLLVAEMVSGRQQVGQKRFVTMRAAEIAVAGDGLSGDPDAPTYTSFRTVSSIGGQGPNRAPNLVGQAATATLSRAGSVGSNVSLGLYKGAKYSAYNDSLGHNIPQAMWDFLNARGVVQREGKALQGEALANWVYVMGYPITEAYWARVKIDGIYYDALHQLYERRSLIYVPGLPEGWQVQMGNVGQHYYAWLYGGPLPTPLIPLASASPTVRTTPTKIAPLATMRPASGTPRRTPTSRPQTSATPTPTYPIVPTQEAEGLVLSVRPGDGPASNPFSFFAAGLAANEQVRVTFTDPLGRTALARTPNSSPYVAARGKLSFSLTPSEAFEEAPIGTWLFGVRGEQSGREGVIGFVLR